MFKAGDKIRAKRDLSCASPERIGDYIRKGDIILIQSVANKIFYYKVSGVIMWEYCEYFEKVEETDGKCNCELLTLTTSGCKCGGN